MREVGSPAEPAVGVPRTTASTAVRPQAASGRPTSSLPGELVEGGLAPRVAYVQLALDPVTLTFTAECLPPERHQATSSGPETGRARIV